MHTAKYRDARQLRRRLRRTPSSRRATWSSCSASTPSACASPTPASTRSSGRTASAPTSAGRTSSRSRRSSRARTSTCSSRRQAARTRRPALAVVGAAGWGEQPALDRPRIVRLGYVDDDELARLYRGAAVVRLPVAVRGLRDPDRRGDGERRPGRRLVARVDGRGRRRRGRCAPIRRTRRRSRAAIEQALADRGAARRARPRARRVASRGSHGTRRRTMPPRLRARRRR